MLAFASGDLFALPADIRVNTVNCVGVMGAGIALAFKTRYPDMFKDYQRACREGTVQPGKPHLWSIPGTSEVIVNLPTKRHWRQPSRYEDVEAGLVWLREYVQQRGATRVALPALGAGNGGLDWERVKVMIQDHLSNLEAQITVFNPLDSRKMGREALVSKSEAKVEKCAEGKDRAHPPENQAPNKLERKRKGSTTAATARAQLELFSNDPV